MCAHWTPWFKSRLALMGPDNLLFLLQLYWGVIVCEFYQDDKNHFGPGFSSWVVNQQLLWVSVACAPEERMLRYVSTFGNERRVGRGGGRERDRDEETEAEREVASKWAAFHSHQHKGQPPLWVSLFLSPGQTVYNPEHDACDSVSVANLFFCR